MMNTFIPLSVAFIDERGIIINIEDMKPHTQDTHPAAKPARYALEMNRGWFAKRGIQPGAKVEGYEERPRGSKKSRDRRQEEKKARRRRALPTGHSYRSAQCTTGRRSAARPCSRASGSRAWC